MAENRCPLIENCQQKSAVCNVQLPDETCYWFRWFRALDENPWHTGTPTEGEDYLVQYKNSEHDVLHFANLSWFAFNRGGVEWQKIPDSSIVAWQKIEPYKENEDGRTD